MNGETWCVISYFNEWIFFLHCSFTIVFLFAAFRFGKEAVIVFTALSWILANLFVTKQITLGSFEVTASDVYAVGAMLSQSAIQEFYGRDTAIKSVWISFAGLIFTTVMSQFHLIYEPSVGDTMHQHFYALLSSGPRLVAASLITFFISSRVEIALFQLLKTCAQLPFALRSSMTASVVVIFDTCLFTWLGLSGIATSLLDICIISSLVKLSCVALISPFLLIMSSLFPTQTSASKVV